MSSVSRAMACWRSGAQVLQGTHVVQPVGQLDEHDPHIAHHGQQHLAHVFGLAVFAVGELDFVDLGDAFDDVRDLLAEKPGDVVRGHRRVFDSIVQQAGGDRGGVQLHLRQDMRNFQRMQHVGLARGAQLALMMFEGKFPGAADDLDVVAGTMGAHGIQQRTEASVN